MGEWIPMKEYLLATGGVEKDGAVLHPDCGDDTIYLIGPSARVYIPSANEKKAFDVYCGKDCAVLKGIGDGRN